MTLPNPITYHAHTGQPLPWPTTALYDYITHQYGIIKRAISPHFRAAIPVSNGANVAGLLPYTAHVELSVPRAPASWLGAILLHARQQRGIEQMYHLHYTPAGWRVEVPAQQAEAGRVSYAGGDAPTVVCDLHSHHVMPAYFSETDDADEQGLRFYAVIGRIYDRPEIRLRVGVYGDWWPVPAAVLFAGLGPFMECRMEN